MVVTNPLVTVDVHLADHELNAALAADVARGLTRDHKQLPPKYFYDDRGCELFEAITELDEYYPTRREREILTARAATVAALTGAETLVELGSGTSDKTRCLLDALYAAGTLQTFVPFDVAEPTLRSAAGSIAADYPGVAVHAVVGDFERHLGRIPRHPRRLIAFLGGTIGNLDRAERLSFLRAVAGSMAADDAFLLGTDLVKDPRRLLAAYDDAEGVTAEFNRNVLSVLNRELDADFDPDRFGHVAFWNPEQEWIEMRLRARDAQRVTLAALGLDVEFAAGEDVRTEISAKFRRPGIEAELVAAGLRLEHWWTDAAGDFALSLSRPGPGAG